MEYEVEFSNIRAEVLLNYLYPELGEEWIVENLGLFYRNYQEDLISLDEKSHQLSLARSSYLKLLPSGMISNERSNGSDAEQRENERRSIRQLTEIFKPVDSFYFRRSIGNESFLAMMYEQRVEYLLKHIYRYDLKSERSKYVRDMAPLLLLRDRIKGDMGLIRDLLSMLLDLEVKMDIDSYHDNDWSEIVIARVVYTITVEDLSKDRYRLTREELDPLCEFILEWFVPLDMVVVFKIHDTHLDSMIKGDGLLGYNLKLNGSNLK
ncbi:MAG: hypothetical protein SNG35_00945 [Rikenellaceae bacterium]